MSDSPMMEAFRALPRSPNAAEAIVLESAFATGALTAIQAILRPTPSTLAEVSTRLTMLHMELSEIHADTMSRAAEVARAQAK